MEGESRNILTDIMGIIPPFSALIPWEYYDYQGHIALYVALTKILNLINNHADIDEYELQIEGEEDFSLRKNGKYKSLHQVKAGKVDLNENDKFALLCELIEYDANGYLHINPEEKIPNDFCNKTLNHIKVLISEFKKNVIYKSELKVGESEEDYIVVESIKGQSKKGSAYSILKYVIGTKDYSKDTVNDAISFITDKLEKYKNKIEDVINNDEIEDKDSEFVEKYSESFDNNMAIKIESIQLIKGILDINKPEYSMLTSNSNYLSFVYDKLFIFMKDTITEHIRQYGTGGKCLISFEAILNVISSDYHSEMDSQEYQYYRFINSVAKAYAEYPRLCYTECKEKVCSDCCEKDICNLSEQIRKLVKESDLNKKTIINNLLLHEPQNGQGHNMPTDSLISDLLCDVLKQIDNMKVSPKNVYQAINNSETVRLTLDESRHIYEIQKILNEYIKNVENMKILFESDVLITDKLNNDYLIIYDNTVNVLGEKELEELKEKDIIKTGIEGKKFDSMSTKVLRLVNKEKALGEFE